MYNYIKNCKFLILLVLYVGSQGLPASPPAGLPAPHCGWVTGRERAGNPGLN